MYLERNRTIMADYYGGSDEENAELRKLETELVRSEKKKFRRKHVDKYISFFPFIFLYANVPSFLCPLGQRP